MPVCFPAAGRSHLSTLALELIWFTQGDFGGDMFSCTEEKALQVVKMEEKTPFFFPKFLLSQCTHL